MFFFPEQHFMEDDFQWLKNPAIFFYLDGLPPHHLLEAAIYNDLTDLLCITNQSSFGKTNSDKEEDYLYLRKMQMFDILSNW